MDEAENSECISTPNLEKSTIENINYLPISTSKDMGISMSKSTSLASRVEVEQGDWQLYDNDNSSTHNNEKLSNLNTPEELR